MTLRSRISENSVAGGCQFMYFQIHSQSYTMVSVLQSCYSSYPQKSSFLHFQPSGPSSGSSHPSPYSGCPISVHPVLSLLTSLFLIAV